MDDHRQSSCRQPVGAWFGADQATRLASQTLYRVLAVLLVGIAVVLIFGHHAVTSGALLIGITQAVAGVIAGFVIGIGSQLRRAR